MKIARIFTGDINNRKGKFNNIYERIIHLKEQQGVEVDVFLIQYTYSGLFRKFKKVNVRVEEHSTIDGITFKNIWVRLSLYEYFITHRLKLKDIACKNQLYKFVDLFKDYDILSVHDLLSSHLAASIKKRFKIPFVITWHGSDINKYPFTNKNTYKSVRHFLEYADYNFFVSKKLKNLSDSIAMTPSKTHLYTGPSRMFFKKSESEKLILRERLGISSKFVVGFIGSIIPIKNVMVLPDIFHLIHEEIKDVSFVIIGNGSLLDSLKRKFEQLNIPQIICTGNVEPERIPDFMNSLDAIILPSLFEGLPRVTLEAQACGVHVVGSDVGGIPEAIGEENSFALDDNFIRNASDRIIAMLKNGEKPKIMSDEFSWENSIKKELDIYNSIVAQSKATTSL